MVVILLALLQEVVHGTLGVQQLHLVVVQEGPLLLRSEAQDHQLIDFGATRARDLRSSAMRQRSNGDETDLGTWLFDVLAIPTLRLVGPALATPQRFDIDVPIGNPSSLPLCGSGGLAFEIAHQTFHTSMYRGSEGQEPLPFIDKSAS